MSEINTNKTQLNGQSVSGNFVSREVNSNIVYSDIAEYFPNGESEPKWDDLNHRIVWSESRKGRDDTTIEYELATVRAAKEYTLKVSTIPFVKIPVQLDATVDIGLMLALKIGTTAQSIYERHRKMAEAISNVDDIDLNAKVAGTSDKDGNITFTWLDALYLLLSKGEGRGVRNPDGSKAFVLDMNESTFDELMKLAADETSQFYGKIKEHVKVSRKTKEDKPVAK